MVSAVMASSAGVAAIGDHATAETEVTPSVFGPGLKSVPGGETFR
jgi:hypothetical protein